MAACPRRSRSTGIKEVEGTVEAMLVDDGARTNDASSGTAHSWGYLGLYCDYRRMLGLLSLARQFSEPIDCPGLPAEL